MVHRVMRYILNKPREIEYDAMGCFALAVIFLALMYIPALLVH